MLFSLIILNNIIFKVYKPYDVRHPDTETKQQNTIFKHFQFHASRSVYVVYLAIKIKLEHNPSVTSSAL